MNNGPDIQNRIASLREVARDKPNLYDVLTLDLGVARNLELIRIQGDFLYVYTMATSASAAVRFNETTRDAFDLKKGFRFQLPFTGFYLTNAAQPGVSITILVGKDLAFDFAELAVVTVDAIQNAVKSQAANNMNVAGSPINVNDAAGGTQIVVARAGRQSVTVVVEGANPVRFGANGVTFAGGAGAAGGILLQPGQSYTFYTTAAVYGICGAGLNSNVGFEEEYNT